jgi:hypothetical protein
VEIQHPEKWCCTLFLGVLHWYEQIKDIYVAQIDWTTAVDYVILLEYMQQIDHGENTNRKDPLTYMQPLEDSMEARDHKRPRTVNIR